MFEEFNFGSLFNINLFGVNGNNIGLDPNAFTPTQQSNDPNIVTRFLRQNDVVFVGSSLCPDKVPNYFLDQTNVNEFCQKSNRLQLSAANNASIFAEGEGIVDVVSNCFATVLSTSNNIVYLNQNFLNIRISPYGSNTFSSGNYSIDDVVYQTTGGVVTFQGKVSYYDSSNGVLAVQPTSGTLNAAGNVANSTIYKLNSTVLSNSVAFISGNTFIAGGQIRSATNASNVGTIVSLSHASGVFLKANVSDSLGFFIQANTPGATGNTITITSGVGIGTVRSIVSVRSNNELVLNAALPTLVSNTRYTFGSHVVDEFGKITGIFNIPENDTSNFPAGERVFTITDSNSTVTGTYLMRATSSYNVTGAPRIVTPPPVIIPPSTPIATNGNTGRRRRRDPLSQTFFTPEVKEQVNGDAKFNYGIYVSSVDLFFAEKPILADLQLPVTVDIVTVENGIPTENIIASKTVECKDVKVSTVPDAANSSTITNFKFDDPVYLEADTQYALVVKSDSPDYNAFICELGASVLGATPPRRVSIQPYIGSFFKSQNASTWTPIQNQDLMFRINKCVFTKNTTGTVLFKPKNQYSNVNVDSLLVHSLEINHKPTLTKYKFKSNNVSNTQDTDYTYLPINYVYGFGSDLLTSTKSSTRRRRIVKGDSNSFELGVEFTSSDSDVSPLVNIERASAITYENDINDAGITNTDISIVTVGSHLNVANIVVTISAPDLADGVQANAYIGSLSSGGVSSIIVDNAGSGYVTTPIITISEPAAPANATAVIAGETSSSGGNCKTRYLTKQITLADGFDAGDLRVYLDANRPRGTNIHVYYKVKSASDAGNFSDKKWQLMQKVSDLYSKDQKQIIELEYRPSLDKNVLSYTENGTVYPLGGTFKYYALKIVMTAEDPTVSPLVKNFRAIATPAG